MKRHIRQSLGKTLSQTWKELPCLLPKHQDKTPSLHVKAFTNQESPEFLSRFHDIDMVAWTIGHVIKLNLHPLFYPEVVCLG